VPIWSFASDEAYDRGYIYGGGISATIGEINGVGIPPLVVHPLNQ
jgi:hypothetical protein